MKYIIPKRSWIFLFLLYSTVSFSQYRVVKIWPTLAPGTEDRKSTERIENDRVWEVYQPDLTVFLPNKPNENRPAVLIFPGGGYTHVTIDKEGYKIAEWLNENGIAAFVLKYRLNRNEALADAQRAFSFVRSKVGEYNINPDKIGFIGFSAGGHLGANLIANPDKKLFLDAVDSVSNKPDFAVFVYGAVGQFTDKINKNHPPAFIVHTSDDPSVPVEQSIEYYTMLLKKGVPAEIHIFEKGAHGYALEPGNGPVTNWSKLCIDWLKVHGFVN